MASSDGTLRPARAPASSGEQDGPEGGAYGGLDDYYLAHGLTAGYESEPLGARALAELHDEGRLRAASDAPRETRALWVSRFDLPASPSAATVQAIVDKAAYAHLNVILFQVRGQADALYRSSLEPWSSYASGTFGKDPGWDPLAEMVLRAHAQGLEVHAWLNAYPAWLGTTPPPAEVRPQPLYHEFNALYGDWWVQWQQATPPVPMTLNANYLCACPAHPAVVERIVAVSQDLLARYPLDGLHFDYIRYDDRAYSYDPASLIAYANMAATTPGLTYADWQRAHVTALLERVRDEALPLRPRARLSASAWPVYKDRWNWFGGYDGYSARYQDSQGWGANGVVSAIMPMMYGPSFTNYRDRYQTMAQDFVGGAAPGAVLMGISGEYTSFTEIAWRIETARSAGARGQALFSYRLFDERGYWQALRDGPYRQVAAPDWPATNTPGETPAV